PIWAASGTTATTTTSSSSPPPRAPSPTAISRTISPSSPSSWPSTRPPRDWFVRTCVRPAALDLHRPAELPTLTASATARAAAVADSCTGSSFRVPHRNLRKRSLSDVWTWVSGAAGHPGHRAGAVRREPAPSDRSVARVESQGVQEGCRGGQSGGPSRRPAEGRSRRAAVRRAKLRALRERARPGLDPLPPVRDGGDARTGVAPTHLGRRQV